MTKNTNRIPRTSGAFKTVVEAAGSGAREVYIIIMTICVKRGPLLQVLSFVFVRRKHTIVL